MRLASSFRNPTMIRENRPLTDDEIARFAPSIFATEPHESRSQRYTYIPTGEVLAGLRKEGFEPFMACQTRVRNADKREFTKHMMRLRHVSRINQDETNEIILLNSHDGTSSYQMIPGRFRFVCANGMVCGESFGEVRVRHSGDVISQVIEGAFEVLDQFEVIDQERESMREVILRPHEQTALAQAALAYRYDQVPHTPITPEQVLSPRRWDDRGSDLWTTFNRVQENLIKGGLHGRNAKGRPARTRAVTGIDQDVKLNRALWVLADALRGTSAAA